MATWREVEIGGKRADLFVPAQRRDPQSAVLFLHGHARITLKDNPVYTAQLEKQGLIALCPHGERSWWANRICREFDEHITPLAYLREQVLPWFASEFGIKPPAIGLLGISMGGQGALRLSYAHPNEFPVVVALSPIIDVQLLYGHGLPLDEMFPNAEAVRQETVVLHLHPLNWPRHQLLLCDPSDHDWFDGFDRLLGKLRSTGIPFEVDAMTRAGGHSWEYFNHQAPQIINFLVERLEKERLRLPVAGQEDHKLA